MDSVFGVRMRRAQVLEAVGPDDYPSLRRSGRLGVCAPVNRGQSTKSSQIEQDPKPVLRRSDGAAGHLASSSYQSILANGAHILALDMAALR